ncbi:hypothetical protein TNCT_287251 [Trichonephila clavata]|uniref:Uncharacterized protein n=1 Tax=Trichonephila clavata TaxID=2740835 RepID=A0A8X6EZG8_TRICU|nr:hypothetical protein TNCT_287251 [Trichonephila clavata]
MEFCKDYSIEWNCHKYFTDNLYSNSERGELKFDEILPCTEELSEEFEDIKKKAEELAKTEEELRCKVDKELDTLCKKIMDLQSKSGCKSENSSKIVATVLKSRMDNLEIV